MGGIRKRGGVWETRIIFWIPTCRMPLHQMGILRISIVFMSLMCLIDSEARTLESEQIYLIPESGDEAIMLPIENKRSSDQFFVAPPSRRGEFDSDYLTRYRRSGNEADYLTRYRKSGNDYLTRYRKSGNDCLTRYRKSEHDNDYFARFRRPFSVNVVKNLDY